MDLTDVALTIPCGYCGVTSDRWCRTASDRRAPFLHSARTVPIYNAYGAGYLDAEETYRRPAVTR